jgi:hypothetical protein
MGGGGWPISDDFGWNLGGNENDPPGGDWPLGGDPNDPPPGGDLNDPPSGGDLSDPPSGGDNDPVVSNFSSRSVPEPGTLALLGTTLLGLVFVRRKR